MEIEKHPHAPQARHPAHVPDEPVRSDYLWCLICERAYERAPGRDDIQLCPYEDCKGRSVFYSWDWNRTRKVNPGYPRDPHPGMVYPLFGRGDGAR